MVHAVASPNATAAYLAVNLVSAVILLNINAEIAAIIAEKNVANSL